MVEHAQDQQDSQQREVRSERDAGDTSSTASTHRHLLALQRQAGNRALALALSVQRTDTVSYGRTFPPGPQSDQRLQQAVDSATGAGIAQLDAALQAAMRGATGALVTVALPGEMIVAVTPAFLREQHFRLARRQAAAVPGSTGGNATAATVNWYLTDLQRLPPGPSGTHRIRMPDGSPARDIPAAAVGLLQQDAVAQLRYQLQMRILNPLATMAEVDPGVLRAEREWHQRRVRDVESYISGNQLALAFSEIQRKSDQITDLSRRFTAERTDTPIAAAAVVGLSMVRDFSVNAMGAVATAMSGGNILVGAAVQSAFGAGLDYIQQGAEVATHQRSEIDYDGIARRTVLTLGSSVVTGLWGLGTNSIRDAILADLTRRGYTGMAARRLADQLFPAIWNALAGRVTGTAQARVDDAMANASAADRATHTQEQWNAQSVITELVSQLLAASPMMGN